MIANPTVPAFRYDPYLRALTEEEYAHGEMRSVRKSMVARASRAERWGVVLGTLGRQGNPAILEHLERRLRECGKAYAVFLISEMNPAKMALLKGADAFAQIACPRLSIDRGEDLRAGADAVRGGGGAGGGAAVVGVAWRGGGRGERAVPHGLLLQGGGAVDQRVRQVAAGRRKAKAEAPETRNRRRRMRIDVVL